MKKNFNFILFIVLLIILVICVTLSILFLKYRDQGKFNLSRKKFDVVFTNAVVNDEDVKLKINNEKKFIHIDISSLKSEVVLSLDVKNIANIDALVKNFSYSNINTNAGENDVLVTTSINNGDVIKKGEAKKLNVIIKNNTNKEDIYYNFNINYLFEEYNL